MLNKIILIGRLVRDPELRYTPGGVAVARFTLAVDRPFTNKEGEREADFIDIVVWQKQAENCKEYLSKGRLAAVEGRLQIRSYDDSQGIRRKAAEVVAELVRFLDGKRENSNGGVEPPPFPDDSMAPPFIDRTTDVSNLDEEVPF
ncbi:single-stranded DNA-binding protein [Desulfofundulus thermocisternus]|jgi:single-strand DNA-binding protein|uniref:single-stranded DNA-binding protein n=1 Tax=Desulfofundulus thermocisternus TaxID=42471 RepID=UPI00217CF1C8|nr:single-stranded DNA-binding protein [Desulfofundulus thermocisternus]MCS5696971.1 single-stranded DNA-binding protein [Desulfofundulus thermocisternus]